MDTIPGDVTEVGNVKMYSTQLKSSLPERIITVTVYKDYPFSLVGEEVEMVEKKRKTFINDFPPY